MDLALLVLRLVVGLGIAAHGAQKLFGSFGGGGIKGTAGFFEGVGLRPGRFHARAAGTTEFVAGALLAFGLLTPLAGAGVIAVMTAAIATVHLPNGFFNANRGYEYNLTLAATAFAIAGIGAGDWSLDNALGLDLAGAGWALAALGAGLVGGFGAVLSGRVLSRSNAGAGQPQGA